jgi:serine/threonine protein kinase
MFHMPSRIDRYEIKTLIGAGGMGSLYLARDTNPNTNRLVALKLLLANLDSGDLRERFARESRALAALNHPNIVCIYDSGEFQGSPFIVMEYIRGETLAEKIKRREPMTVAQKLRLMVELCSGLQHAHEAGIIHRDIKPANLMVDQHGRLKILDFGIARVSEGLTRVEVTQLNMRIGTPGYMSPEQIEGGEIDRRSDVFAAGTVCYELLTYREAFTGSSTRQVENKVLQTNPEPLTSILPDLDPQIEAIVTRALAKDPNQRYQDAAALEEDLERLRWRMGRSETPPPPLPKVTPDPSIIPGRHAPDSRAEGVYQRCLAVYAQGAHDAARRFAIEALAEDPDHEGARDFMKRFGPSTWVPLPPRAVQPYPGSGSDPTVLRTGSHPMGTLTADAETVLSTGSHLSGSSSRTRTGSRSRFGKGMLIAAIAAAVVALVGGAVGLGLWMWKPGPTLTVIKPEGGTLSSRGINCGTGGSDCSTQFTKGDPVNLLAEPDEGFVFAGFTGDCKPKGWIVMTTPRTCGATFTKIPVAPATPRVLLTIVPPTGGTIVGDGISCGVRGTDCSVEHPQGKVISLKSLAEPEFTFKGFSGECSRGEMLMNQPRRCGAVFVKDRATVAGNGGGGGNSPSSSNPGNNNASTNNATVVASSGPAASPDGGRTAGGSAPGSSSSAGSTATAYDKVTPAGRLAEPADSPAGTPKPEPALPTPDGIAKDAIQRLLEAYRAAYEQRDLEAIKRVYPAASGGFMNGLKYAFKDYKSLEYTYTGPPEFLELNPALGTAIVKIPTLSKPEYKGPGSPPQKQVNQFTLKRHDDKWSIAQLTYPPK